MGSASFEDFPFSRRALVGAGAVAATSAVLGAAGLLRPLAVPAFGARGFDSFEPDNPYAKPTDLYVPSLPEDQCIPPNAYWASRGAIHSNKDTYYADGHGSFFLYYGTWFTVIPLDNAGDWGWVKWPNVGTYKGRSIGCKLTVSNPTTVNHYNHWGYPDGWPGNAIAGKPLYWGTRHFFVACDCFSTGKCHWLLGLSSLKMTYEFFYTGNENNMIDLEWAYLTEHSLQCDGGGYEWAGPSDNHQGHAFTPSGVSTVLRWANHDWHDCVESPYDEISDRTTVMFDYKGRSISCWRGDTVGQDGFNFEFLPIAGFRRLKLKKTSSLPQVSASSDRYSLEGAEYGVWCDSELKRKCGTFTTDADGNASVQAVNGTDRMIENRTYWVRETKASPGYELDPTVYTVWLDSDKTLEVAETPEHATVRYHCDGIDSKSICFTDYVDAGFYTVSERATAAAKGEPWFRLSLPQGTSLDISYGVVNATANGTNVQVWKQNDTLAQRFRLIKAADGTYQIQNFKGWGVEVPGGSAEGKTANVRIWQGNDGAAQRWHEIDTADGTMFKNVLTGCYLTAEGAGSGSNVCCAPLKSDRAGQVWTLSAEAAPEGCESVGEGLTCNLDAHYGEPGASGFTGWFSDRELTAPFEGAQLACGDTLDLYARNRASIRIAYAEGSVLPEDRAIWRTEPVSHAPESHALELADWSSAGENHMVDGIALPAIGDDGPAHRTLYRNERLAIDKPHDAFAQEPDGTWRRFKAKCWLKAADGGDGTTVSSIKVKRDATLYVLWKMANSEGVEAAAG